MAAIITVGKILEHDSDHLQVQVAWVGLEDEYCAWKPLSAIYTDIQQYVMKELKKLKPKQTGTIDAKEDVRDAARSLWR